VSGGMLVGPGELEMEWYIRTFIPALFPLDFINLPNSRGG
jgi:hypothetical protein